MAKEESSNVRVICRFRPLNEKEKQDNNKICYKVIDDNTVLIPGTSSNISDRTFALDRIFPSDSSQEEVYDYAAKPVIEAVLQGYNGTVLAYGQTASGKTYTMQGLPDDPLYYGVIPRMVQTIFDGVDAADEHIEFTVRVSIIEIYMEKVKDLLNPIRDNLKIHEDKTRGIYVSDITEEYITNENDLYDLMKLGLESRKISPTNMNDTSSRSHLIFMLTITQKNLIDLSMKTGKLYLVDLAGSEKISKTNVQGGNLDEAKQINKSLSALGNVINALTDKTYSYIPYRDSKLTRVLQESIGGNSKTCLIVTCSPANFNELETLSSLRFGQRAKKIKNIAKINEELTVDELKLLLEKSEQTISEQNVIIKQLKLLLKQKNIDFEDELKYKNTNTDNSFTDNQNDNISDIVLLKNEISVLNIENSNLKLKIDDFNQQKREWQILKDNWESKLSESNDILSTTATTTKIDDRNIEPNFLSDADELLLAKQNCGEKQRIENLNYLMNDSLNENDKNNIISLCEPLFNCIDNKIVNKDDKNEFEKNMQKLIQSYIVSLIKAKSIEDECKELFEYFDNNNSNNNNEKVENVIDKNDNSEYAKKKIETLTIEKRNLLKDLSQKTEKIIDLERLLQEERIHITEYKELLRDVQSPYRKKVALLDRNLEQLTILYHRLITNNSGLKVHTQVLERRLLRREYRIEQLENALKEARIKYENLLKQCSTLTCTIENLSLRSSNMNIQKIVSSNIRRSNITKPLKGGSQSLLQNKNPSILDASSILDRSNDNDHIDESKIGKTLD